MSVQWAFEVSNVVQRRYSGKVENVYMILQQIYSGTYAQNFIRTAQVLQKILKKAFWSLFPDTVYNANVNHFTIK